MGGLIERRKSHTMREKSYLYRRVQERLFRVRANKKETETS